MYIYIYIYVYIYIYIHIYIYIYTYCRAAFGGCRDWHRLATHEQYTECAYTQHLNVMTVYTTACIVFTTR